MDMSNRSSKDIIDLANKLVKYVTTEFNQIECREALEAMDIKTVPENKGYKENPKPEVYSINTKRYITWQDEIEKTVMYAQNIKKLREVYPAIGYSNERTILFLATNLVKTQRHLDPTEDIKVLKIPLKEVKEMLDKNEIITSNETVALMHYFNYERKEDKI